MGARRVLAIDNDLEACSNSLDNILRNGAENVEVREGDLQDVTDEPFDIVMANINRNIILAGLPWFHEHLFPGGILVCSGFLTTDSDMLVEAARSYGLQAHASSQLNGWAMVLFGRSA
jgi:ribosomal protein L11 methyltransferase